jgi:hypothetical protein
VVRELAADGLDRFGQTPHELIHVGFVQLDDMLGLVVLIVGSHLWFVARRNGWR